MGLMGPETIRICRKLRTDTQISLGLIILIILWCEAFSVLEKLDVSPSPATTLNPREICVSVRIFRQILMVSGPMSPIFLSAQYGNTEQAPPPWITMLNLSSNGRNVLKLCSKLLCNCRKIGARWLFLETFAIFVMCPMGRETLQNYTNIAHKCPNFPGPGAH